MRSIKSIRSREGTWSEKGRIGLPGQEGRNWEAVKGLGGRKEGCYEGDWEAGREEGGLGGRREGLVEGGRVRRQGWKFRRQGGRIGRQ
jgi:hypothetical protein